MVSCTLLIPSTAFTSCMIVRTSASCGRIRQWMVEHGETKMQCLRCVAFVQVGKVPYELIELQLLAAIGVIFGKNLLDLLAIGNIRMPQVQSKLYFGLIDTICFLFPCCLQYKVHFFFSRKHRFGCPLSSVAVCLDKPG